jgi:hypothetical protein
VVHAIRPVKNIDDVSRGTSALLNGCIELLRGYELRCIGFVLVNEKQIKQYYLGVKVS